MKVRLFLEQKLRDTEELDTARSENALPRVRFRNWHGETGFPVATKLITSLSISISKHIETRIFHLRFFFRSN